MKAVVFDRFGEPDVLQAREISAPQPGDHDLLVDVRAASLNPVDYKIRRGKSGPADMLPRVTGCDIAGVVARIGSAVTRFKPGDAVFGCVGLFNRNGACAQQTLIDERLAAIKPEAMSFAEAASLPIVAITAFEALYDKARLAPGQRVVITAGGGGVGSLAIQLARLRQAEVIATAGRPESLDLCRRLGAGRVIDYSRENPLEAVMALTDGQGADVVMDNVGGDVFRQCLEMVAVGGQVITIVERGQADLLPLFLRSATLHVEFMGARVIRGWRPERHGEILREVAVLVAAGSIQPTVTERIGMADVADAHARLEQGHVCGKIVVEIS